jgi:hypothetical protein
MGAIIKRIIQYLAAAFIPLLYGLIIKIWPDFPLAQNQFIDLLVWLVCSVILGFLIKGDAIKLQLKNFKYDLSDQVKKILKLN